MTTTRTAGGASAVPGTPARERCPHCNGFVEALGKSRTGAPVKRCLSCGREPSDPVAAASAPTKPTVVVFTDIAAGSAPRPCRADGCPGTLDAGGRCACCARRAAFEEKNRPVRLCEICEGQLPKRAFKRCHACAVVSNRVKAGNSKAATK